MIKNSIDNGVLTIFLEGKVDSTCAPDVEKEIFDIISISTFNSIVLDVENLTYISSAGLRIVLKIKKSYNDFKVINASTDVFEIFEITGFSEMITIEKAYRRVSVDGCDVIGIGANGKVYRLDSDTVIKAYFDPDCLPDIKRERELARTALILGVPTAIPYDVVKVGDSFGSVFELLNAKSFAELINSDEENLDHYVDLYVDVLKKMHQTNVESDIVPDVKISIKKRATFLKDYLPSDKYAKLIKLIDETPNRKTLIHGDYHVKNVMMQNGEVLLIDMDALCYGHPVFEFAAIYMAYEGFYEYNKDAKITFLGLKMETSRKLLKKTLEKYFNTTDESVIKNIKKKAMLICDVRLMRRSIRRNGFETEEGVKEINTYKEHILNLLDQVDSLDF